MRKVSKSYKIIKFLAVAAVLAALGLLVFKVYTVSYEKYQINKKITILDDAMDELNNRGNDLKALIAKLESADYLEKEARKKLNFQKPGEKPVIITKKGAGADNGTAANKSSGAPDAKNESNLSLWYDIFFGK